MFGISGMTGLKESMKLQSHIQVCFACQKKIFEIMAHSREKDIEHDLGVKPKAIK